MLGYQGYPLSKLGDLPVYARIALDFFNILFSPVALVISQTQMPQFKTCIVVVEITGDD